MFDHWSATEVLVARRRLFERGSPAKPWDRCERFGPDGHGRLTVSIAVSVAPVTLTGAWRADPHAPPWARPYTVSAWAAVLAGPADGHSKMTLAQDRRRETNNAATQRYRRSSI
ncbi:MAG: hypothetical protein NVS4B6_08910 [Mycobacterium sp.]